MSAAIFVQFLLDDDNKHCHYNTVTTTPDCAYNFIAAYTGLVGKLTLISS